MKYNKLVSKESRVVEEYVHRMEIQKFDNFKAKTHPIPYKYKVNDDISKLLDKGIIKYGSTQFINSIIIGKKKNNKISTSIRSSNHN